VLIINNRLSKKDIDHWYSTLEYEDELNKHKDISRKIAQSINSKKSFTNKYSNDCYLAISWGKDSVAVAYLVAMAQVSIPMVWIKTKPFFNPDCELVRDEFLRLFPNCIYREVETSCATKNGKIIETGRLKEGIKISEKEFGQKVITGIRGDESSDRKIRQDVWGIESKNTLAPIIYWKSWEVFLFLLKNNLPVHPVYAMTKGGLIDRDCLRVSSIGGSRGNLVGRHEWEKSYYPDILSLRNNDQ
jgi:phosphoadenosine phosphosulfate reductase